MAGATLSGAGALGTAATLLPGAVLPGTGSAAAGATVYAPVITFPGRGPNALGFKCELLLGTTWTDVTQYVMLRDQVRITNMGRTDQSGSISAAQLALTLKNTDGRFTPKNAGGAYYPDIVRNCQVRISISATSAAGQSYSGYRFWGEVSAWPPGYDISQRDSYIQVTASGIWRRVAQSQVPIGSCFWRYANLLTGSSAPAAYWAMEDGNGSAAFVLSEGTGTNIVPSGTPSYAADGTSFAGSNALPQLNGARLAANVTMASTPSSYAVRFALAVPAAGDSTASTFSGGGQLVKILTAGTVATVSISVTGNQLVVTGSNSGGSQLFTGTIASKVNGVPVLVSYEQTGTTWALRVIPPGGTTVLAQASGSGSLSVGKVTQIQLSPQGRFADTTLGQVQVFSTSTVDLVTAANCLGGRSGELAGDRFLRLCAESGVPATVTGGGGAAMGPQVSDTLANVLQTVEDTDGGLLFEPHDQFGLGYRTLASMKDQVPGVALAYTSGALGAVPAPVYDDSLARNSWTVTNYDAYAVLAQCTSGPMSVQPPPNGLGSGYAGTQGVNTSSHSQVAALAQQLLYEGCCDEVRFPVLTFNFQRTAAGPYFATIPALRIGDYLSIGSLPSFLGGGTAKQLIWGWAETLGGDPQAWTIQFNAVPESPFESSFSPGVFSVTQVASGGVAAGSQVGSSVTGSQLGPGTVPGGGSGGTLSARSLGGVTQYVSATTPYDWSFAVSGTPADGTYFICTSDQSLPIAVGDTFTSSGGFGGPFTVTAITQPSAGTAYVYFTPTATSAMTSGTVFGGKNGDTWVNTAGGNQIASWQNGQWQVIQFGQEAVSFSVSGIQVTFAATAPSSPNTGDLWYDTSSGNRLNQWNGSAWVAYTFGTSAITAGSVTAALVAANTLTSAQLATGAITASSIAVGGVTGGAAWSFTVASGGTTSFFAVTQAQGSGVKISDTFTWSGQPGQTFTVTSIGQPVAGQIGVGFSPSSTSAMTSGTVTQSGTPSSNIAPGTITASAIEAATITASQIAAGIVIAGVVDGTTIMGASFVADGTSGEILVYSGSPASGNLIGSWSGGGGSDGYSNPFAAGLEVQQGGLILVNQSSAPSAVSGASSFYSSVAGRPRYLSSAGSDAVLERSDVNVSQFTVGNTATFGQISADLSYFANEGNQSSEYEIEVRGNGVGNTTSPQTLTFQLYIDGSLFGGGATAGATFFSAGTTGLPNFRFTYNVVLSVITSGSGGTATASGWGMLTPSGNSQPTGNCALTGLTVAGSFDTTSSHTLELRAAWGATASGQTLTTYRTKLARRM